MAEKPLFWFPWPKRILVLWALACPWFTKHGGHLQSLSWFPLPSHSVCVLGVEEPECKTTGCPFSGSSLFPHPCSPGVWIFAAFSVSTSPLPWDEHVLSAGQRWHGIGSDCGVSPETLGEWLLVLTHSSGEEPCLVDSKFPRGFALCQFSVALCFWRNELPCVAIRSKAYLVYNLDCFLSSFSRARGCFLSFPPWYVPAQHTQQFRSLLALPAKADIWGLGGQFPCSKWLCWMIWVTWFQNEFGLCQVSCTRESMGGTVNRLVLSLGRGCHLLIIPL